MQPSAEERIEHIATLVADYWCTHPDAADLVEGIAWWVPEIAGLPPAWVQSALERLVQRGVAVARQLPDGRTIYASGRPSQPPSP
jgi:hypothetical protein